MVGRPKKVINRLVEKWEHEQLLKVMARKIQRAKPTLSGKTGASSKTAKSTPASVSPTRRPSIISTPGNPLSAHVASSRGDTCPETRRNLFDKPVPGAPLIAELERAANGGSSAPPGKATEKPPWKGPLDDMVGDFGGGFEMDELPAGPSQRRKTFAGFDDSTSWDPIPRPGHPSATPQSKPHVPPVPKKSAAISKKQNHAPVLLVIPNEPKGPLRPKPRLSRKFSNGANGVSEENGDVSKVGGDAGKAGGDVRGARAPLQAKSELLNAMPASCGVLLKRVKKTERPSELRGKVEKEENKGAAIPQGKAATSAASVAGERQEIVPTSSVSAREAEAHKRDVSEEGDELEVPLSDVSPRQPDGAKPLPSSKIPKPRGAAGLALAHRARHSLRFGGGGADLLDGTTKRSGDVLRADPRRASQGSSDHVLHGRPYSEDCEEDFPVHQADSGEFVIRTPSSGIDQPLTASEESALERQAGNFPAILLPQRAELNGTPTNRNETQTESPAFSTELQQEIEGLNNSLEAMKETLRGMNGTAALRRGGRSAERRNSGTTRRRAKGSARSTGSRASDVSSLGLASEDGDTCRTGESDDEGGLARGLEGLTLVTNGDATEGIEGTERGDGDVETKFEAEEKGAGLEEGHDLDAQIAQQEQLRQALLRSITSAAGAFDASVAEHQRDFLNESQGEWAVVTGEESHVSSNPRGHVSALERGPKQDHDYEDDFEAGAADEGGGTADESFDVEGVEARFEADAFDVEGEELVEVAHGDTRKASPRAGFLARLSYQVDGVRGSREESLPASPDRLVAGGFASQLTARGTKRVPDMEGLTAEIEKLEQEMQRLRR